MNQEKQHNAILITGANGGLGSGLIKISAQIPGIDMIVATDIDERIADRYRGNNRVLGYRMDVSSEDSIREIKHQLEKKSIRVKYLINNAGVNAFFPVTESTETLLDKILKVNLYGQILTVSVFLEDLIATKGRVIQISSDSVRLPIPFHPYPASKISMEAFSISMRRELKLFGVDLVLIRPGAIQTNFLEEMKNIRNGVENSKFKVYFENFTVLAKKNIGKRSEPSQVAKLVLKVIKEKNPKLVYSINKNRKISFFELFPIRLKDKLITKSISD